MTIGLGLLVFESLACMALPEDTLHLFVGTGIHLPYFEFTLSEEPTEPVEPMWSVFGPLDHLSQWSCLSGLWAP